MLNKQGVELVVKDTVSEKKLALDEKFMNLIGEDAYILYAKRARLFEKEDE